MFDVFIYLVMFFFIIFVNVGMYSSPISAVFTIVYFVSNLAKPSKNFKRNSILFLILNFLSIVWTKVGIFFYELAMALSNESAKYYNFHGGLGKSLQNISYVLPFLVLIIALIMYPFIKKPIKIKEVNETDEIGES